MAMTLRPPICSLLAAIALALGAPEASPQGFAPTRVVKIISPLPSGLGPDVVARLLAERLTHVWGQQVIVEPRPGANGFIALGAVKRTKPDGYELGFVSNAHLAINPNLFKNVPYDSEKDFTLLSMVYRTPFFLVVSTTGPHHTMPELIAHAKANPGKLTYSSPYIGSPPHLGGALFAFMIGTQMLHIPYKEGQQVYTSVANGDVDLALGSSGSIIPLVKAGKIKPLAIAAKSRAAGYPDVPTVEEAGGPAGYTVDSWGAMIAPQGMPADLAHALAADIVAALAFPETAEGMRRIGFEPTPSTQAQLADNLHADLQRFADLIKRAGITAE
jgi:tripartite-type tricarboxylate transporter receptor subunit TctC